MCEGCHFSGNNKNSNTALIMLKISFSIIFQFIADQWASFAKDSEVLVRILKYVTMEDFLQNVALVSKKLYKVVNDNSILWKCFEDFSVDVVCFD